MDSFWIKEKNNLTILSCELSLLTSMPRLFMRRDCFRCGPRFSTAWSVSLWIVLTTIGLLRSTSFTHGSLFAFITDVEKFTHVVTKSFNAFEALRQTRDSLSATHPYRSKLLDL